MAVPDSPTPGPAAAPQACEISAANLPLCCPGENISLWNPHPRVYLPIEPAGEALCPYCGTRYLLSAAAL